MTLAAGRRARTLPAFGDAGSLSPRSRCRLACFMAKGLPSLPREPEVRCIATPPIGTARPLDMAKAGGVGDGVEVRESGSGRAGGVGGNGVDCALEREEVSESESNSNAAVDAVVWEEGRRRGTVDDEHRGVDTYRRMLVEVGARRRVALSGVRSR